MARKQTININNCHLDLLLKYAKTIELYSKYRNCTVYTQFVVFHREHNNNNNKKFTQKKKCCLQRYILSLELPNPFIWVMAFWLRCTAVQKISIRQYPCVHLHKEKCDTLCEITRTHTHTHINIRNEAKKKTSNTCQSASISQA